MLYYHVWHGLSCEIEFSYNNRAWKEAERDLAGFFTLVRLRETAWIAVSKAEEAGSESAGEAFLKEFLAVREILDRKDNQLFFR